jgi:hypothetical protein
MKEMDMGSIDRKQLISMVLGNALAISKIAKEANDPGLELISRGTLLAITADDLNMQEEFNELMNNFMEASKSALSLRVLEMLSSGVGEEIPEEIKDIIRSRVEEELIEYSELPNSLQDALRAMKIKPNSN